MISTMHDLMTGPAQARPLSPGAPALMVVAAEGHPAAAPATGSAWLRPMLDAIDYGAGLLLPDGTLADANAALRLRLAAGEDLRLDAERRLHCLDPRAQQRLVDARQDACQRGLRRLVVLGAPGRVLALVGLAAGHLGAAQPCLLLAQRAAPCERLSLGMFARLHALTQAETRVLQGLVDGDSPEAIGVQLGVRLCTVRTHIANLRAKTGMASMRELMQCIATLPPIVHALAQVSSPAPVRG